MYRGVRISGTGAGEEVPGEAGNESPGNYGTEGSGRLREGRGKEVSGTGGEGPGLPGSASFWRDGAGKEPARVRGKARGCPATGRSRCAEGPCCCGEAARLWGNPWFSGYVGISPHLWGGFFQNGPHDPSNAGGILRDPSCRVPTKLEWMPLSFQLQNRCWEEAGTEGGDGDTHSGVAVPSPSSAPHHPWAVPGSVGQRPDPTGWTL